MNRYHIQVQILDIKIMGRDGKFRDAFRLFRTSDGNKLTIQPFSPDQRVTHEVLWEWCVHFGISAGEAFKIVRV